MAAFGSVRAVWDRGQLDWSRAACRAIETEAARGAAYEWGTRDCSTLIEAVCRELGSAVPPYAGQHWREKGEARAAVKALREYGSLGAAHQRGLVEHCGWTASRAPERTESWSIAGPELRLHDSGVVRPCDVVSYEGKVLFADSTCYEPRRPAMHATGIAGPECAVWMWTERGLSTVCSGTLSHLTRFV